MATSLYLITNSKLTGNETQSDWNRIVNELQQLNMDTTSYFEKGRLVKETGDWNYKIEEEGNNLFNVDFEGPFHIQPKLLSNIGVIYTIYKYRLLYEIYGFDWFNSFRKDLYNIVKIIGGTEVIYLADNCCDKLESYLVTAEEYNVPYEDIKQKMIEEFGQPITDYSKLNFDKLDYSKIDEFFCDNFSDLKVTNEYEK